MRPSFAGRPAAAGMTSAVINIFRIFCHAYGKRVVLLLGGYDKGAAPGGRRQQREIETAHG